MPNAKQRQQEKEKHREEAKGKKPCLFFLAFILYFGSGFYFFIVIKLIVGKIVENSDCYGTMRLFILIVNNVSGVGFVLFQPVLIACCFHFCL